MYGNEQHWHAAESAITVLTWQPFEMLGAEMRSGRHTLSSGIPRSWQALSTGVAAPTDCPAAKAENVAMIKVDAGPPAAPAEKPDRAGVPAPTNGKDSKAAHPAANGGLPKGVVLRMLLSPAMPFCWLSRC